MMQATPVRCVIMLGKTYESQLCSIARFQRTLGIATNVLKARLDNFVDAGVMRRHKYSERPALYEYLLTDKGRALSSALVALTEWGDRWATDGEPPVLYAHSKCGARITQRIDCPSCGRVTEPIEVRAVSGPAQPRRREA